MAYRRQLGSSLFLSTDCDVALVGVCGERDGLAENWSRERKPHEAVQRSAGIRSEKLSPGSCPFVKSWYLLHKRGLRAKDWQPSKRS